jgi:hypothetical protein
MMKFWRIMMSKHIDLNKIPDPKLHQLISFIKSGLRIGAGTTLIQGMLVSAGVLLILAEILGVVEELV